MKTYLTYGFGMTLAGAAFTLVLYFLGYHSDAEKMASPVIGVVGFLVSLVIVAVGLILAMRTARENPPEAGLTYGRGVLVAVLTGLFYGLFSAVFQVLYAHVINPEFYDVLIQVQMAAAEAKGTDAARLDQAEGFMRKILPIMSVVGALFMGVIISTVVGLIVAAFMKRPPEARLTPPPITV